MTHTHPSDDQLQDHLEAPNPTTLHHLEHCAYCRTRMQELEQLVGQLNQLTPQPLSYNLEAVAMQAVVQHVHKRKRTENQMYWGLLLVAALVLALFAWPLLATVLANLASTSYFSILLAGTTGTALVVVLIADLLRQYKAKEKIIETL